MEKRIFPALGHVGIIVPDINESVNLYKKVFGKADFEVYTFSPLQAWYHGVLMPEYKLKIGMGTMENGTKVELIQPITSHTLHDDFLKSAGGGIHHMAFYTSEFEQWKSYFKGLGSNFIFEAEIADERGYRRCFYAEVPGMACIVEFAQLPVSK